MSIGVVPVLPKNLLISHFSKLKVYMVLYCLNVHWHCLIIIVTISALMQKKKFTMRWVSWVIPFVAAYLWVGFGSSLVASSFLSMYRLCHSIIIFEVCNNFDGDNMVLIPLDIKQDIKCGYFLAQVHISSVETCNNVECKSIWNTKFDSFLKIDCLTIWMKKPLKMMTLWYVLHYFFQNSF